MAALETSAESPAAVRTISRLLGDYIGRLGAVWIDGQVALNRGIVQYLPPYAHTYFPQPFYRGG